MFHTPLPAHLWGPFDPNSSLGEAVSVRVHLVFSDNWFFSFFIFPLPIPGAWLLCVYLMILPILASSAKGLEPSRVFDGISLNQSRKENLYLYYKEVGWFPRSPGHFVYSLLSCGLKQMQISVGRGFPNPWLP